MLIRTTTCLLLIAGLFHAAQAGSQSTAENLSIERLTWAGIKFVAADTTVFVDPVGTDLWEGSAPEGLVPVQADTTRRYALVSHSHNDHFDVATLRRVLGERGYVIVHDSIATYVASRGLQVIPAKTWVPVSRGGFTFIAVPAADGFGAEQVSWVIVRGEHRYLHGGDTLWHGKWDDIGAHLGPFDAVFLPINGARMQREPMPETPGTMTPLQAVDAAMLLRAKTLIPIHYGLNDPPLYTEVDNPLDKLHESAGRQGMPVVHLLPGEFMRVN